MSQPSETAVALTRTPAARRGRPLGSGPAAPGEPACRHCGRGRVNRPRGLCWSCYHTPGVKEMYPPTSKHGRRGVGHGGTPRPLPDPTPARAGTPEKLAELARRAELGLELWHPLDGGPTLSLQNGHNPQNPSCR